MLKISCCKLIADYTIVFCERKIALSNTSFLPSQVHFESILHNIVKLVIAMKPQPIVKQTFPRS